MKELIHDICGLADKVGVSFGTCQNVAKEVLKQQIGIEVKSTGAI